MVDILELEGIKMTENFNNKEFWDSIFKKLDAEEKKYIETDLSPWLTETYSEDEKKEYLELKAKAMHMSKEEIYDNVGKYFGIWWRISREELRRRETNKYRKPKNPPQEYYEPEGCPEMTDFENVRVQEWESHFLGFIWSGHWVEEKVKKGYWIGWDYAHDGDFCPLWPELGGREWTADEVALEAKMVIEELIKKEK